MPLTPDEMAKRQLNVAEANELVGKAAGAINQMMMLLALESKFATGFDAIRVKNTFEAVRQDALAEADKLVFKLKESLA